MYDTVRGKGKRVPKVILTHLGNGTSAVYNLGCIGTCTRAYMADKINTTPHLFKLSFIQSTMTLERVLGAVVLQVMSTCPVVEHVIFRRHPKLPSLLV